MTNALLTPEIYQIPVSARTHNRIANVVNLPLAPRKHFPPEDYLKVKIRVVLASRQPTDFQVPSLGKGGEEKEGTERLRVRERERKAGREIKIFIAC